MVNQNYTRSGVNDLNDDDYFTNVDWSSLYRDRFFRDGYEEGRSYHDNLSYWILKIKKKIQKCVEQHEVLNAICLVKEAIDLSKEIGKNENKGMIICDKKNLLDLVWEDSNMPLSEIEEILEFYKDFDTIEIETKNPEIKELLWIVRNRGDLYA